MRFELHPWVASVERITRRLPSSLDIELKYRRPIAAVESSDPTGVMFLPIDDHAVRLPEGDLTETERRYLPRVSGITGRPRVGDVWDDPRVIGGAKLAAQLADVWQQLRLVEILANSQNSTHDEKPLYTFEIVTTGGTRIIWGATPGQESSRRFAIQSETAAAVGLRGPARQTRIDRRTSSARCAKRVVVTPARRGKKCGGNEKQNATQTK